MRNRLRLAQRTCHINLRQSQAHHSSQRSKSAWLTFNNKHMYGFVNGAAQETQVFACEVLKVNLRRAVTMSSSEITLVQAAPLSLSKNLS